MVDESCDSWDVVRDFGCENKWESHLECELNTNLDACYVRSHLIFHPQLQGEDSGCIMTLHGGSIKLSAAVHARHQASQEGKLSTSFTSRPRGSQHLDRQSDGW